MIIVEQGGNKGTWADRLFTLGTNIIQSTIVKARVYSAINKRFKQTNPRATEDFSRQLEELGLSQDKLWWGPMTLFPRKAQFLLTEIERQPPKRILEVGGGTSTILFAALAAKHGFSLLCLDNYKSTIDYIQSALQGIPCDNRVKLQHCGLVRGSYANGEKYRWYDAKLDDGEGLFDFVFIDGPVSSLVGRNGALPEIKPYLAKDHRIFMDDYNREHEKACVAEWKRHFPDLIVNTIEECSGVARLNWPNV